jgi:exocyst complex component 2
VSHEDAHILYYLEAWVASPSDPSTTLYLSQMELFQRQITTAAFKIAGGIDLSSNMTSTKPTKQNAVAPLFISKITKAFLDVLYAFLDGLVHLASEESPIVTGKRPVITDSATITGTNPLDLLDLTDTVSSRIYFFVRWLTSFVTEYASFTGHLEFQLPFLSADTWHGQST